MFNFLHMLGKFFYPFFVIYMLFIEITYTYFKHIKNDCRFKNIGIFKYFESPIKTLRGDFKC